MLKEKNIVSVSISSKTLNKKLTKEYNDKMGLHTFKASISDPFKAKEIAKLQIVHSFEYVNRLYERINKILLMIFAFALFIFLIFYIAMKRELDALKVIANAFQAYSKTSKMSPIVVESNTSEIQTIKRTANEMIEHISSNLLQLERFNTELEKQVEEKVEKLTNQEQMMIHQSRQAAMGEMLESIAHQWRQPLNIIGLSCANLEMQHELGINDPLNFKDKMEIISKNINYMSNTIDDFRDFLNPDREAILFEPQKTIEAVYDILAAQLENNKIKLNIRSVNKVTLYGIENEFKQVVFVLINNSKDAIKCMQKNFDNFQGEITITLMQESEKTSISFCDNGGGIDNSIIHSVFDPYFTTKFASSGTGIGLYIAKNIIESRMHGTIKVFNTKNGCCFTIEQNQKDMDETTLSTDT
ncbi:MAG: HAMP domain-containing histidine kinase [Campylobacterales bacterium]|nr:HAMP domain-containing histidine kinase [Campylobacterales bacterium]